MDLTKIKTVRDFNSESYSDTEITNFLQKGWVIVAVRTERDPSPARNEFTDKLIYTLGHESETP